MNSVSLDKADLESVKTNFDSIYLAPDPREYFRVLMGLDYIIPDLAKDVFRALIEHSRRPDGTAPKVVDIGSSYGINSAVVDYPLDVERLARRYAQPEVYSLPTDVFTALDRSYFAAWPKLSNAQFIGVDPSVPAATYAQSVGLLHGVVTTNLEHSDPTPHERSLLRDADLIITTGCVGYVTATTFRRILECQTRGNTPMVASFVLRMYSYEEIQSDLARAGLVTEKLDGVTFVQRRLSSSQEAEATLRRLDEINVDPTGKEADGLLHAELFVSRPEESVRSVPLSELISITSGESQTRGQRFKRVNDGHTDFLQ